MSQMRIERHGPNATTVHTSGYSLCYSYDTIVGFFKPGRGWVLSENVWSVTTAKHMTRYFHRDRATILPNAEFEAALAELTK